MVLQNYKIDVVLNIVFNIYYIFKSPYCLPWDIIHSCDIHDTPMFIDDIDHSIQLKQLKNY